MYICKYTYIYNLPTSLTDIVIVIIPTRIKMKLFRVFTNCGILEIFRNSPNLNNLFEENAFQESMNKE